MSATQIRKELHRIIDIGDDRMVTAVYAMMQNYLQNDESIVATVQYGEGASNGAIMIRTKIATK